MGLLSPGHFGASGAARLAAGIRRSGRRAADVLGWQAMTYDISEIQSPGGRRHACQANPKPDGWAGWLDVDGIHTCRECGAVIDEPGTLYTIKIVKRDAASR